MARDWEWQGVTNRRRGMRTYALSDIHGCLDKLAALVARCRHDAGDAAKFVFLGDYIDRGPDSRGVLEYRDRFAGTHAERRSSACAATTRISRSMRSTTPSQIDQWVVHNGGDKALRAMAWPARPSSLPITSPGFARLKTHHDDGRRFFVHAGIDPARPLDRQDRHDLLWMREPFLSDPRDYRPLHRARPHAVAGRSARPAGEPREH